MEKNSGISRRRALLAMVGLASSGVSGCCLWQTYPKDKITSDLPVISPEQAFLRPKTIGTKKPTKFAIDAHAHFFNASDVNAGGYIKGPVAHTIKNPKLRNFVERLAPVVDRLAYLAPTAAEEFASLTSISKRAGEVGLMSTTNLLQSQSDGHRRRIARDLTDELKAEGLDQEYILLRRSELSSSAASAAMLGTNVVLDEATVLSAIDPTLRQQKVDVEFISPEKIYETVDGALEFVGHMLSPRWMNIRDYRDSYSSGPGAFGIDGVFGSLVDFDYWLGNSRPKSGRGDQIRLHALLSRLSGGYMLPLVAYNPWSDIVRNDESFDYVVDAIDKFGFVGIKIYPPMGYYPYGNDELPVLSPGDRPDSKLLDKKLARMFKWAAERGVPVMAHTNESMGRDDDSDEYGGPRGWGKLFEAAQDGNWPSPTINAAHFGGDAPKEGHPEQNWPQQFGELMKAPKGDRLFGDLGYWSALRQCPAKGAPDSDCTIAKTRIQAAIKADPKVVDRVMYGTDWLMLSKETKWANYAGELASNLEGTLPLDKVMYQNALNCFGLGYGQKHRERVVKFLKFAPKDLPPWLTDVA